MSIAVLKGHGTENDFVIVPDLEDSLDLTADLVRALCDRHAGVGGDGVLRVVRSEDPAAPYFMDYRNADGSIAEMCGNGVRVFVRYLQHAGLVTDSTDVLTRGGIKHVSTSGENLTVTMGRPGVFDDRPKVTPHGDQPFACLAHVEMPNPHVVVLVDSAVDLADLDLDYAPVVDPALPNGQNVEFIHRAGDHHLAMRVYERGVGETRSCGTGICAVVAAVGSPDGSRWQVDVPGGTTSVVWREDGEIELTGPAVLVGEIELDDTWLAEAGA
ncbi:MAG TPA: diaminopimelate epimerase [Jatrophihabitans sp.]|jgi:diaminopimelate epimerase